LIKENVDLADKVKILEKKMGDREKEMALKEVELMV